MKDKDDMLCDSEISYRSSSKFVRLYLSEYFGASFLFFLSFIFGDVVTTMTRRAAEILAPLVAEKTKSSMSLIALTKVFFEVLIKQKHIFDSKYLLPPI